MYTRWNHHGNGKPGLWKRVIQAAMSSTCHFYDIFKIPGSPLLPSIKSYGKSIQGPRTLRHGQSTWTGDIFFIPPYGDV